MTCQYCGSSSQLIFIGTKSVSVYRHVAGVRLLPLITKWTPLAGLGSITIVIVIDCNRLQLERNRNCNRNQIFQIVA